jgi:hypothetical protein
MPEGAGKGKITNKSRILKNADCLSVELDYFVGMKVFPYQSYA